MPQLDAIQTGKVQSLQFDAFKFAYITPGSCKEGVQSKASLILYQSIILQYVGMRFSQYSAQTHNVRVPDFRSATWKQMPKGS